MSSDLPFLLITWSAKRHFKTRSTGEENERSSESLPSGLGAKRKVECTAVKVFHVSIFSLASPLCARSLLLNRQATQVSQEPENKWPSGFPRSNIAFQAVEKSEVPFKEDIFAKKVLEYQFSL